jgi:hypothetical protein
VNELAAGVEVDLGRKQPESISARPKLSAARALFASASQAIAGPAEIQNMARSERGVSRVVQPAVADQLLADFGTRQKR